MVFDKKDAREEMPDTGSLEGTVNKIMFFGSFLASLGAGMFLGESADAYVIRPMAQKYAPELNLYWTFAASAATGVTLTVLGWKKLLAPLFYRTINSNNE